MTLAITLGVIVGNAAAEGNWAVNTYVLHLQGVEEGQPQYESRNHLDVGFATEEEAKNFAHKVVADGICFRPTPVGRITCYPVHRVQYAVVVPMPGFPGTDAARSEQ